MQHSHRDDDLTIVSFSNETPAPPERRTSPRNISILRTALLRTRRFEELCLVRNISIGGLMAHVFCEVAVGDSLEIEFKSERSVGGRVVWRRDQLVGVQFQHPIDLAFVLSNQFEDARKSARAPRVDVDVPARIRSAATWQPALLRNISQGGACLGIDPDTELLETVLLEAPGLSIIPGSVRWRESDSVGIAFDRLVPFADIAQWVADSHRAREGADDTLLAIE